MAIEYIIDEEYIKNTHYMNRYNKMISLLRDKNLERDVKVGENHHILPEKWYPELRKDHNNLIRVTLREHFILHYILGKACGGSMWNAVILMKRGSGYSSRLYEIAKLYHSRVVSERQLGTTHKSITIERMKTSWETRGDKWTNGEHERYFNENELGLIPDGWYKGTKRKGKSNHWTKGSPFWTNSITKENKRQIESPGPDWVKGRTLAENSGNINMKTKRQRYNIKTNINSWYSDEDIKNIEALVTDGYKILYDNVIYDYESLKSNVDNCPPWNNIKHDIKSRILKGRKPSEVGFECIHPKTYEYKNEKIRTII